MVYQYNGGLYKGKKNKEIFCNDMERSQDVLLSEKGTDLYLLTTLPFIGRKTGQEYIFRVPCMSIKICLEGHTKS